MNSFTEAYIEAALWAETDDDGEPLDARYSLQDIAPATLQQMEADCARFLVENELPNYGSREYSDAEMAGHDFWLTRNHHGAGFWDRGLGEIGRKLTEAAHRFGGAELYVGDDGKIYQF